MAVVVVEGAGEIVGAGLRLALALHEQHFDEVGGFKEMMQVVLRGEQGKRTLFVLPAALFVISLTVFPLLFGLIIAFSSWNLSSPLGRQFNGLDNVRQMWSDPFYWNALKNMVWYSLAILVEYAVASHLVSRDDLVLLERNAAAGAETPGDADGE